MSTTDNLEEETGVYNSPPVLSPQPQIREDNMLDTTAYGAGAVNESDPVPIINPEDSVSNVSSKLSSVCRAKITEMELKVQLEALEEQNKIENEKLDMQRKIMDLERKQKEIELKSFIKMAKERTNLLEKTTTISASVTSAKIKNVLEIKEKEEKKVTPNQEQPDVMTILNKLVENQRDQVLPNQEISVFDGTDILSFETFVKNFEYVVENYTVDTTRRLEFLLKYTRGEARELIQSCPLIKPPEDAYKRAWTLLNRDYGNPQLLASAYRLKAREWPQLQSGDKAALRKFSIFLVNCVNSMTSNTDMSSMDSDENIYSLCAKLPKPLQQRWITEVGKLREDFNRGPKLSDFEKFVGILSRNENDPRISGLGYQQKPNNFPKPTSKPSNPAHVHSVQTRERENTRNSSINKDTNKATKAPCLFCGRPNHSLVMCREFQALRAEEKSMSVQDLGLCFACLNPGHIKENCPNAAWSKCELCPRSHATIMHDPARHVRKYTPNNYSDKNSTKPKVTSGCVKADSLDCSPLMAIVPVQLKLKVSDRPISTYAFVDNGSGVVFLNNEISNSLKLRCKPTEIVLKTINLEQNVDTLIATDVVQISGLHSDNFMDLPQAYIREEIPVSMRDAPQQKDIDQWDHLKNIKLPKLDGHCLPKVTVMIGINFPAATTPLEMITGNVGEPYAIRSPLGWLFYGLTGKFYNRVSVNYCQVDNNLDLQVKKYFNLEFSEKLCDERQFMSVEDKRFIKLMESSIKLTADNHYETELPLRNRDVIMPNNKLQANIFASKLKKRLYTNESLCNQYTEFMNNLESKNYSEKVPEDEISRQDGKVWYIPHHNVTHPKKPNKVRVVFNCPLTFNNTSLNQQLLPGPDLTNKLLGVLLRWRQDHIAIMSDIESMFYQVRVQKTDIDLMRYLWWPNGDTSQNLVEYRMLVHLFGAVSSPSCSNFALKQVASDNIGKVSQNVIESINNDFYVDDFLKSLSSESEAIALVKEIREVLKSKGFNLTKWVSNSRNLLKTIPLTDRVDEFKDLDFDNDILPMQRVLGVKWCVENDKIEFSVNSLNTKATRRNILSVMSSVYDPLGFACPFILNAKIILQQLCHEKLSWDQAIPEKHTREWLNWIHDLPNLEKLSITRCLKPKVFDKMKECQLHHFADASQDGYATVSYLRFLSQSGEVYVSFVMGRSRVAPIKPHTIVKLELAAATSIVRINNMLNMELTLSINKVFFWTDSQTVLKYIANEKIRHQVFVSNRLAVIRDGSTIDQWKYVPGKLNPADIASRGATVKQLIEYKSWLRGPDFLWCEKGKWPEQPNIVLENPVCAMSIVDNSVNSVNKLFEHYSDWHKLKRSVSWWLRLRDILRLKVSKSKIPEQLLSKQLSLHELDKSENEIVKFVQRCSFPEELKLCESNKNVKLSSDIIKLDPFLKDGVLRVGGRLRNAKVPYGAKHQVILPKGNHVSVLIIRFYHVKVGHSGRNHTLSEIRKNYWIIRGGVMIKGILSKCIKCRKYQSKLGEQKMADLPSFRLKSDVTPFAYCGIDYFGHFEIKNGRSLRKRYGVVFSCFSSRAIHIEVADSLDTSSCIDAIKRFCARRGFPREIFSDNGTNLIGAKNELKKSLREMDQTVIENFALENGVKWNFNAPTASHHGGAWERQIRTIRKVLQALLSEQFLKTSQTDEQLRTLFCEVESIVKSRPLTRVSNDPNDFDVITPNSLLLLQPISSFPMGVFSERDIYSKRRWRQMQYLAQLFWKRWTVEYLPMLQQRQKWLRPNKNFNVDDIVLIVDDSAPRCSWPMGVITEVYPNKQGLVRSVKINTKTSILVRPITKLCLILEQEEQ